MNDIAPNHEAANIDQYRDLNWGAEQLLRIFLFKPFTVEQRKRIYSMGSIQIIKRSAHAVIEGEPTRGLFIILSGQLSVYKRDPMSNESHRLASLKSGDSFGELSLFDQAPRSATVSAESPSFLFALEAQAFEAFLQKEGDAVKSSFYRNCAAVLSEKLRILNSDYIASQQLIWKYALRKA